MEKAKQKAKKSSKTVARQVNPSRLRQPAVILSEKIETQEQEKLPKREAEPAQIVPTQPAPRKESGDATLHQATPESTAARQVKITFFLFEPEARQVLVSGEFNGWSKDSHALQRDSNGKWQATIPLIPGRYQYKFIVDGHWVPDPLAKEQTWNEHGTLNSVIEVN